MATKSIRLSDGTNDLYPMSDVLVDISSSFTYSLGSGDGRIRVLYDRVNKIVRGCFSVYNASNFGTNTAMFNIASEYRPSSLVELPATVATAAGTYTFLCKITTTGGIYQAFSANATGAYGTFEYQL